MRNNIQNVAQRGDRLDVLQDKTDNLAESAQGFRRGANRVRKQMWWKDMKMRVCIVVGIIILLVIIIVPSGEPPTTASEGSGLGRRSADKRNYSRCHPLILTTFLVCLPMIYEVFDEYQTSCSGRPAASRVSFPAVKITNCYWMRVLCHEEFAQTSDYFKREM